MSKLKMPAFLLITLAFLCVLFIPVNGESRGNSDSFSQEDYSTPLLKTSGKVPLSRQARQFVLHYIRENRKCLYRIKQRSKSPFKMIETVFSRYHLPLQLKYLAVIESELKTKALSPAGAKGPWQLMPETAQLLGLKINPAHDERSCYDKSTKAAARYLKDLYAELGDWLLVLAAYNGGTGPVYHAIHLSGSHNFWALQSYLPAESRLHVKKFIATHYYFEGQGGETTFTRAEWTAYNDHLRMLKIAKNLLQNTATAAASPVALRHI